MTKRKEWGIICPTVVSARVGEPSMLDLERGRLAHVNKREIDEDCEIALFVAQADSLDRRNNETAEQQADKVANAILHGDHGLLNRCNDSEDLVNCILLECTYPVFPASQENGFSAEWLFCGLSSV
jgi:hypothetical protein